MKPKRTDMHAVAPHRYKKTCCAADQSVFVQQKTQRSVCEREWTLCFTHTRWYWALVGKCAVTHKSLQRWQEFPTEKESWHTRADFKVKLQKSPIDTLCTLIHINRHAPCLHSHALEWNRMYIEFVAPSLCGITFRRLKITSETKTGSDVSIVAPFGATIQHPAPKPHPERPPRFTGNLSAAIDFPLDVNVWRLNSRLKGFAGCLESGVLRGNKWRRFIWCSHIQAVSAG